jgi:hypothetical protein
MSEKEKEIDMSNTETAESKVEVLRRIFPGFSKHQFEALLLLLPKEDTDELQESTEFTGREDGSSPKGESDVITAKSLEKLVKYGHAPESLTLDDGADLTPNEKQAILNRHAKIPANIVPNIVLIRQMGNVTEQSNEMLYENNEINLAQYKRNEAASIFAKEALGAVIDNTSAVEGARFEGLIKNAMSGKLQHAEFEALNKEKKAGRLSRLRGYLSGDREEAGT